METIVLGFTTPASITELYQVIELAMLRRYHYGSGDLELLMGALCDGAAMLATPHSLYLRPAALHWHNRPHLFCIHSRAITDGRVELYKVHIANTRPVITRGQADEHCWEFCLR